MMNVDDQLRVKQAVETLLKKRSWDKLVDKFTKSKVLVFGDVGVDKYTVGHVSRISPEAPIPILEVKDTVMKLGLAANVADNLSSLGAEPVLVGLLGDDRGSEEFRNLCKEKEISVKGIVTDTKRMTIVKERVVADQQQVVRIDYETPAKADVKVISQVWNKIHRNLEGVNAVIVEDYAKGLVDLALFRQLVQECEKRQIPLFVDPNSKSNLGLYYGCTVITPNTLEAEALSGIRITDIESLYQAGQRILDQTNSRVVVLTRGKEGMALFAKGEAQPLLIPTFAREVFDVSGAGDTTIAVLSLALANGCALYEAAVLANFAAGVVVGKRGTATVGAEELRRYLEWFLKMQYVAPSKKAAKTGKASIVAQ